MIIDDGSTDNTEEVVQDLLKDTEAGFKIEYVKKEKWRITHRLQQSN